MDIVQLVILIIVAAVDLSLGAVVLQRNSRAKINRLFALLTVATTAWLVLNFMCDHPAFTSNALTLNRLTAAAGLLMGVVLFVFMLTFPSRSGSLPWRWRLLLAPLLVLAALAAATPLVVASVEIEIWGTNLVPGPAFPYAIAWGLLCVLCVGVAAVRRFSAADANQKAQFRYLYIGIALYLFVALAIGAVIPVLSGTNESAHLMPIATALLLVPAGYAVIRHRLMDVQFVVLRAAAYSGALAVSAVAFMALAGAVTRALSSKLGINPDVLLLLAGLLVILSFQYLRQWLEGVTDRYFYRRTYDPSELLSRLGTRIVATIDVRQLASLLAVELAQGMRLSTAAVGFYRGDAFEIEDSAHSLEAEALLEILRLHNRDAVVVEDEIDTDNELRRALRRTGVRVLAPLVGDGVVVGAIALGPKQSGRMFSEQDTRFLDVLVPEASIAMKNAHLFDEKNQRVRELEALNELAFAIGSDIELDSVLDGALRGAVAVTGAESGSIMLLDAETRVLTIAAARGIPTDIAASTRIPLGQGIAGWVAQHREPLILVRDSDGRFDRELLRDEITSAICAPVVSRDEVIGVVSVNRSANADLFTKENLHVVTALASQLGVAIENARLYGDLEKTFLGTISALAAAVDAKDPYTYGHSNEVTAFAVAIAEKLGLSDQQVHTIRIAAILHDIGKIGIDGAILLKPAALLPEEREIINRHPAIGADILASLDFLRDSVPLILFHHERYAGGGYPSGISGAAIPLGARIIAAADSFNAMMSDRPYRAGLSLEEALKELRDNAGGQFDPVVVDAFLDVLETGSHEPFRFPDLKVSRSVLGSGFATPRLHPLR